MAIYIIPCPIIPGKSETIPDQTTQALHEITCFVAERAKTARRYLKTSNHPVPLPEITIFEIDKHHPEKGLTTFLNKHKTENVGILSESGCPGIADPGSRMVSWAHQNKIRVIPLVGPTSIMLALMGSGFSGQSFCFHGYLPNKKKGLVKKLRTLEQNVQKHHQTQIFIEAPYRNKFMLETCIQSLQERTLLSVATDISAPSEQIITQSIQDWKRADLNAYHKRPAVFSIGKYE